MNAQARALINKSVMHARTLLVRPAQKTVTAICGARVILNHALWTPNADLNRHAVTCPGCNAMLRERDKAERES